MGDVKQFVPEVVGAGYVFDPDEILKSCLGHGFTELCVIGRLPNGEFWVSGAQSLGETVVHLEKAKDFLIHGERR